MTTVTQNRANYRNVPLLLHRVEEIIEMYCAGLTQPQRTFRRNYTTHALYFCKASLTARGQSRFMPMTTVVISIVFFHFSFQL